MIPRSGPLVLMGSQPARAEIPCQICGTPFVPHPSTVNPKHCSRKCLTKAGHRQALAKRTLVLGRECRECQATDADCAWSNNRSLCSSCERRRTRKKPARCLEGVEVVIIDTESDRERTIKRRPRPAGKGHFQIKIGGLEYTFPDDEPPVISLAPKVWARTRW